MSRVQLHKFVDIAKPVRSPAERHDLLNGRGFVSDAPWRR
jgi:hypothetical protein